MSGLRYLGLDGADGVLSSSSGTPSENSTAQQARKIRNVHRTLAIVAGSVLCLSGYERGVLGASFTLDSPSAALGKTSESLLLMLRYVPFHTCTATDMFATYEYHEQDF